MNNLIGFLVAAGVMIATFAICCLVFFGVMAMKLDTNTGLIVMITSVSWVTFQALFFIKWRRLNNEV